MYVRRIYDVYHLERLSLMTLFVNITQTFSATITDMIKNQVCNWMASQARFTQAMFSDLCWKS